MIRHAQIDIPNIIIDNVFIETPLNSFTIYPRTTVLSSESFIFEKITINEDMFAESIFGSLEFYDSSYILDQLNLSFYDKISFKLDNIVYNFKITEIINSSDLASKLIHGPAGNAQKITINFSSEEFIYSNFDVNLYENFIGKISKGICGPESSPFSLIAQGFDSTEFHNAEKEMVGLVQTLFGDTTKMTKVSKKPLVADDTFNDIWVKTENFFYPFYKLGNSLRISHLMNYLSEYACSYNNSNAVNFFFWEDLKNWNFKCIDELLKDKDNHKGTYNLAGLAGSEDKFEDTVISMEIISDISPAKLLNTGALFSQYVRIMPDWSNVYRGFLDSASGLLKTEVTYSFQSDSKNWKRISEYPIVGITIATRYENQKNYNSNAIFDFNYGFYSGAYNLEKKPWWNFYDFSTNAYFSKEFSGLSAGATTGIPNKKNLFEGNTAAKEVSRIENEYWQSQFDFSELPGAFLRKIYKEIKWPLTKARWDYAEAKKTKTEWGVYKNVICCDSISSKNNKSDFYALIYAADKIYGGNSLPFEGVCGSNAFNIDSGGIYAYSWQEVEFWPKSEVKDILSSSSEIIEFDGTSMASFPFVFVSDSSSLKGNFDYTAGYTGPDNRAYNLNEILNTTIPQLFESDIEYDTLMMNPGVSSPLKINDSDRKNYSSYPKKYQMMPVGKFRVIDNQCPNFAENGTRIPPYYETITRAGMYYGGRIVQMKVIGSENLKMIRGFTLPQELPLKKQREYMFLFDVDNTHDGLCTGDCA